MCAKGVSPTEDSLGIGGLLLDASLLPQLVARGGIESEPMLHAIVSAARASLGFYDVDELSYPVRARLALRELGLETGLRAVGQMGRQGDVNDQTWFKSRERLSQDLAKLTSYEHQAERIEKFWMKEENRKAKSWTGHKDINAVMLAPTLAPDAFLEV